MIRVTRRWGGPGLLVFLAAIWAGACGRDKKPAAKARPGLVVLERGAEPRMALRYRFKKGETVYYRLSTETQRLHVPGPGTRRVLGLSWYVDRVRGERAQVRWRVEPSRTGKKPPRTGKKPPRRRRGTAVWLQIDHRGRVEATAIPGASADRTAAWEPLLRTLTARWPVPAVGVGARWRDRRKAQLPLRAGVRRSGLETSVETIYRFERVAPCGRSRCAWIGLRIRLWSQHKHRQATIFGSGRGRGEIAFDLDRGRIVSIHTESELALSTQLHRGRPAERYRLVQHLDTARK